jgi:uncharacterized RDD family membrane protein YckC
MLSFVIGIFIGIFGGQRAVHALQSGGTAGQYLLGATILLIYYIPQEALFGRTLGKLVTGTMVVNEEGGKPSLGQVVGRTFSRFIPFEAFSFFVSSARGWHDSIPRTYVVRVR